MVIWLLGPAWAQDPQALRDAQPLPRYLQVDQIQAAIAEQPWQTCLAEGAPDAVATLRFTIPPSGEGVAGQVQGEGVGQRLADCWGALVGGLRFPAHDEAPLAVVAWVAVREGKAVPYPVVEVAVRDWRPLFLFVPPDADPQARARLLQALGLAPIPQAP